MKQTIKRWLRGQKVVHKLRQIKTLYYPSKPPIGKKSKQDTDKYR